MAKVSKREVERKKFNEKVNRLRRAGIPETNLPTKISIDSSRKLTYRDIQKMNKALSKATTTGANVFTGTKRDGTSVSYSKAQLDIANIKIVAENRERAKKRQDIAEKEVFYARQTKKKGVEGARKNKFVEEYAGQRKEMADLTRLGLLDIAPISEKSTQGNVDTYTKIQSAERKFDRNEAELYKENILDSLAWSLGTERGEQLLDALEQTDAEVLLDMYYSTNELNIADWYAKEGNVDDEIADIVEQNVFALEEWAKRVASTGKYSSEKYAALEGLHKKLYPKKKSHSTYTSPNRKAYDERRMRIANKPS